MATTQKNRLNGNSLADESRERKTAMNLALEWLSRTLAILLFMVGPGLVGSWLDKRLGTGWLTPAGLIVGMALATGLLILLAGKLTPKALGRPIPYDSEEDEEDEDIRSD